MFKILNGLKPFFEDNYRRISVREYSDILKISPATASKKLEEFYKQGILKKQKDRIYVFYYANKDEPLFISLLRIYWQQHFKKIGLLDFLEKELVNPTAVLFGSFAKAEINENSDIDLALFSSAKKDIDLIVFEKKLKRKIQLFMFKSIDDVKNKELLFNILNGFVLKGRW